jgi:hypothetical protein
MQNVFLVQESELRKQQPLFLSKVVLNADYFGALTGFIQVE